MIIRQTPKDLVTIDWIHTTGLYKNKSTTLKVCLSAYGVAPARARRLTEYPSRKASQTFDWDGAVNDNISGMLILKDSIITLIHVWWQTVFKKAV